MRDQARGVAASCQTHALSPDMPRSARKDSSYATSLCTTHSNPEPVSMLQHKPGQSGFLQTERAQNSLLRRNLSSLCGLGGETPFLRLPGQDYLYSAAVHLLTLQNFKLLLGCTKQSLIFITCLFILVEKDTANSNPRHPQNACYTLGWVHFLTRLSKASWPSAYAPSHPDSHFLTPPEVHESVTNQRRPQLSRESKLTLQTIFQLFQINFK